MRTLLQPGPVHPRRIESFGASARESDVSAAPRACRCWTPRPSRWSTAGWRGGTLSFAGAAFDPFRYVMPGPPDEPRMSRISRPRARRPGSPGSSRPTRRSAGMTANRSCIAMRCGSSLTARAAAATSCPAKRSWPNRRHAPGLGLLGHRDRNFPGYRNEFHGCCSLQAFRGRRRRR